jgi:hypothetical protein
VNKLIDGLLKFRDALLRWLCPTCAESKNRPEADQSEAAANDTEAQSADEKATAALLLIAQDAVEDERERGRALDTKTASLVGATGLILSLNVTLGLPLLYQKLGPVGQAFTRFFFVIAVIFLFAALLIGILAVLAPQEYRGLGRRQVRAFTSPATQAMTRLEVHQAMLGALDEIIHHDRPVNDCKARLTTLVAFLFALGFIGVAGEALTLWLYKIGA